ncbi:MAG: hypothetical protein RBR18_12145 [Desulfovibrionaceae bacterium]|nr:hypothetical protein [Desulfovibrionaceae bacterium]
MSQVHALRPVRPDQTRDQLVDCLNDILTPFDSLAHVLEEADKADLALIVRCLIHDGYARAGRIAEALEAFAQSPLEGVYWDQDRRWVQAVVLARKEAPHV